ncbi:MAG: HD domain-containing protein [Eggerthellaceae bacterium]|nr:HD domain-containing protein [Eggerthellaceae bacterium]
MDDALSQEFFQHVSAEAKERVPKKRFHHMQGVSDTAVELAQVYEADVDKARLAGILHDWDKGLDNDEIRAKAADLGLVDELGEWVVLNMPQVIHGPTAAASLANEYPQIPSDVLSSIYKHTIASPEMSDLDKIIYISDAIEPNRSFPEVDEIRSSVGKVSLDELYFMVYKFWIETLIGNDGLLHPDTLDIWNRMAYPKAHARLERYEERCRNKRR